MRKQKRKNIIVIITIVVSFFLGREYRPTESLNNRQTRYLTDSFQVQDNNHVNGFYDRLLVVKDSDVVYRCGQSKIYHPTKSHASFKQCKSKVTELTVKRAKALGMRHCKCRR